MIKEIDIKLKIDFPEYEEIKAAIKECEWCWNKDEFVYTSEVTYDHLLAAFPSGSFRIYSSEDVRFKLSFDEMHDGYVRGYKTFDLTKKGYEELIKYATDRIRTAYKSFG